MANFNNSTKLIGRLAKAPWTPGANADGSQKYVLTVAVNRGYKAKDGSTPVDFVETELYVPANRKQVGAVVKFLDQGSLVGIDAEIRTSRFEKDGKTVYKQFVAIQHIEMLESKKAADARRAGEPAVATMPAYEDDMTEADDPAIPF